MFQEKHWRSFLCTESEIRKKLRIEEGPDEGLLD